MINITDLHTTNDYNNITNNCTNSENYLDKIMATLLLKIPCGLPFLCLNNLMIYTLFKPLIANQ